jgi:DHA3 family tetracycline resistance protein-like MFS transporter
MQRNRLDATRVYLFIEFAASASFSMMFVVTSLYEATVAGLSPLQLVLVGTTVEASIFLFEVPTGVVADAYSRRLSLIIGYLLMGAGFMVEGFFPAFLPILLAQIIWGLGYTFTSGATQAWITDEIGEESANRLFLRAARVGLFASLLGMGAASLVGSQDVALPLQVGAVAVMLIGIVLIFIMPETGFKPLPREDRNTWQHMGHTFNQGLQVVRSSPRLMSIVGVGLFFGLYSEGFDRLWVKHLLDNFELPVLFGNNQVAFFAVLRMAATVMTMLALRFVEKRVDTGSPLAIGRAMLWVTGGISAALLLFAFSPLLAISLGLYIVVYILRNTAEPLHIAWINQKLDPQVRATVHSMFGQVDAIGQIGGGPAVALIARFASVALAISTSALLLTPAWFLVRRTNRLGDQPIEPSPESVLEQPAARVK